MSEDTKYVLRVVFIMLAFFSGIVGAAVTAQWAQHKWPDRVECVQSPQEVPRD